ncbi:MAG: hypothetical protein AAFV88_21675 [Planctomycetota bacterium]
MPSFNAAATPSNEFNSSSFTTAAPQATPSNEGFVDRRREGSGSGNGERRQFGSSHDGLSEAGRELALAIDQYKLQHHRRYITCDEMLLVISHLGYQKKG